MELMKFTYVTKFDSMSIQTATKQEKVTFYNASAQLDKKAECNRPKHKSCSFMGNFRKKFGKSQHQPVGTTIVLGQPHAPSPARPHSPPVAVVSDNFAQKDAGCSLTSQNEDLEESLEKEDVLTDHGTVFDKCSYSHC